ncbi:auxin-responsive protein SAUR71-like [Diospyros lotus]|uniref:auxin-responsive protein SAUR71-like n=1 Tax=Diospyros lotus TaxID=55363 RepID=UPI00225950AA|nr:auxin-responsive protein SAUR71-like [Diospyros lotus]
MASSAEKSRFRIYNITRLKRMARKWRKMRSSGEKEPPRDIPPGHLAVTVGEAGKRFVIRADYLNHPVFRQLLDQAYQEYGYSKDGPLTIPCDEFHFQEIIHSLRSATSQISCNAAEKMQDGSMKKTHILESIHLPDPT